MPSQIHAKNPSTGTGGGNGFFWLFLPLLSSILLLFILPAQGLNEVPAATSGFEQKLRAVLDCLSTGDDIPGNAAAKCKDAEKNLIADPHFAEEFFGAVDENKDGALTAGEMEKFVKGKIEPYLLSRLSAQLPPGPIDDRNREKLKDVLREQSERMVQMTMQFGDKNGDGKLDKEEVIAGLNALTKGG